MVKECVFCEYAKKGNERIIYKTKNFFVILPLGCISPGHVMLVSKNHYNAFGEIPDRLDNEFLDLWNKVHKLCETNFGRIFEFEYGNWGQSVNHAHIHFVPYKSNDYEIKNAVSEIVSDKIMKINVVWKNVKQIYKKENCYVLFNENGQMILINVKGYERSNFPFNSIDVKSFLENKKGLKGIKWQDMGEKDKKDDEKKRKLTKEKLNF